MVPDWQTIQGTARLADIRPVPDGGVEASLHLDSHKDTGKQDNGKAIYSFRTLIFIVYFTDPVDSSQIRTIFPGI